MNPTDTINQIESIITESLIPTQLALNVALSLAILIGYYLLRRVALRFLDSRNIQPKQRYHWSRFIRFSTLTLTLILLGGVWIEGVSQIATLIAIILAGLAIALQQPISNLGGWIYILVRKSFVLGDRVEVDGTSGDVADIGPFVFVLSEVGEGLGAEQPTGRIIQVPNSFVFSRKIANSTQSFNLVWDEIPVVVTFESNWIKAKSLLQVILEEHTAHLSAEAQSQLNRATTSLMLPKAAIEPALFTMVVDIGVELTMRYMVTVRGRRAIKHAIWEDVLRAFAAEDDIDFAYPTQRIYHNPSEGKPGAGGKTPAKTQTQ